MRWFRLLEYMVQLDFFFRIKFLTNCIYRSAEWRNWSRDSSLRTGLANARWNPQASWSTGLLAQKLSHCQGKYHEHWPKVHVHRQLLCSPRSSRITLNQKFDRRWHNAIVRCYFQPADDQRFESSLKSMLMPKSQPLCLRLRWRPCSAFSYLVPLPSRS